MLAYEEQKRRNLKVYEDLKEEILTKYAGHYVAIADGRLITVSITFDEADEAVKDYGHRLVFPAGEEPEIGPLHMRTSNVARFHA